MDVLTDTMSTTQMQSKTGRVDSYDAMVEAVRGMNASDDLFTQMQSETRRDAFYNAVATQITVKVMEAAKAAVKAETRRVDSYDDVVEMMEEFHATAASQAAIEVAEKAFRASFLAKKATSASTAASEAAAVAFEAEAYDDVEDEGRTAVAFEVRRYIDAYDEEDAIDKIFRKK